MKEVVDRASSSLKSSTETDTDPDDTKQTLKGAWPSTVTWSRLASHWLALLGQYLRDRQQHFRIPIADANSDRRRQRSTLEQLLNGNTGVGTLMAAGLNRAQPLCGRWRTLLGSR